VSRIFIKINAKAIKMFDCVKISGKYMLDGDKEMECPAQFGEGYEDDAVSSFGVDYTTSNIICFFILVWVVWIPHFFFKARRNYRFHESNTWRIISWFAGIAWGGSFLIGLPIIFYYASAGDVTAMFLAGIMAVGFYAMAIPYILWRELHNAKVNRLLHSHHIKTRYGNFFAQFSSSIYFWILLVTIRDLVSSYIGEFITDGLLQAFFCGLILLFSIVTEAWKKPFLSFPFTQ
jgi:hypothetical protein